MGTEKYYDEIFESNEYLQWEAAPGKDVIIKAIKHYVASRQIKSNAKIIDIGCGTGFLLNRLHQEISENFQLYGIDFSDSAIVKGKECYPDYFLSCEDGEFTQFDANQFDVLVCYGSFEHFENPKGGLKEAARILRSGGFIFTLVPTLGVNRVDRDDEGWYEELSADDSKIHQMQWNLKRGTWESYFEQADFNLLDVEEATNYGALKPGVSFFGINK